MKGEIIFLEKDSTLSWIVPFPDKYDFCSTMQNYISSVFMEKESQIQKNGKSSGNVIHKQNATPCLLANAFWELQLLEELIRSLSYSYMQSQIEIYTIILIVGRQ